MAKRRQNHSHSAPRQCQPMRERRLPQSIMTVPCVNSKRGGEGFCNMASHALEMAGQWPK